MSKSNYIGDPSWKNWSTSLSMSALNMIAYLITKQQHWVSCELSHWGKCHLCPLTLRPYGKKKKLGDQTSHQVMWYQGNLAMVDIWNKENKEPESVWTCEAKRRMKTWRTKHGITNEAVYSRFTLYPCFGPWCVFLSLSVGSTSNY